MIYQSLQGETVLPHRFSLRGNFRALNSSIRKQEILKLNELTIPLAVVLPRPARGAGTLIPSAQRLVWEAKQPLGKAALGALFA